MKRQCILFACMVAILINIFPSKACINPADHWAAGVVWNDSEQVDFLRLDLLAQDGQGISKTGSGDTIVYRYRSHYAPDKAMVRLDRYMPVRQNGISYPRIAMIADSASAGASFNFSAALRVELDWLCCPAFGVLSMPLPQRRQVNDSIRHGNSQYWTRQDRVLSYSEWFTGDTLGGAWRTMGVNGECGLDAAYDPPAQSLSLAALRDTFKIGMGAPEFTIINIRTMETRHVSAVRETSGQYYFPSMNRMPEFNNKLLIGYLDYDSVRIGKRDSVFVTLAIVGTILVEVQGKTMFKAFPAAHRPSAQRAMLYNLRGCMVVRSAGVLLIKENGRIRKLIKMPE